jgi:DNA invertase Pin-like site-specific DNA recombinase
MLSMLESGDTVIVMNTSRLWRSDTAKVIIRRELMKRHAHVIAVENERFDLYAKNPNDRFMDGIMELMDEWERLTIALKLAKGRTAKAKNGDKPAGAIPYGYQYSADRKHVEVNEAEAATVKRMFSLAQTGESLSKITDKINATGATTRRGKPFSKGTIAAVLNNRFYTGELTHAGQTIQGNHTPIISKIQFGKVQSQLAKRKK